MKVFGIGLSKTGTSSLAHALEILGYRTKDNPGIERYQPGDLNCIDPDVLEGFDALTDTPIPSFYRQLDRAYPGSKFILTVRDIESWLRSCQKQFTQKLADKQNEAHSRLFMELYDTTVYDEAKFRSGYQRFVEGVQDYFKDRPDDLLTLDVTAGEGWEKLCPFLNKPFPASPFPKANVTSIRWMNIDALADLARQAGRQLVHAHSALAPKDGKVGWPERGARMLRRAVYAINGGRPHALAAATRAADGALLQGLKRLNPDIPVISRLDPGVPYGERSQWNHFWLVDPLDGCEAFGTSGQDFTVNIALIEDTRPIAGVVYAPLSGETYYAMVGKGAHKALAEGQPIRIGHEACNDRAPPPTAPPRVAASKALTLCRLLDAGAFNSSELRESMEWQSAPAHAIARLIRHRIVDCLDGEEVRYNKAEWANPCIRAE